MPANTAIDSTCHDYCDLEHRKKAAGIRPRLSKASVSAVNSRPKITCGVRSARTPGGKNLEHIIDVDYSVMVYIFGAIGARAPG